MAETAKTARPANNEGAQFVERVENLNGQIDELKAEHMRACKTVRADIKQVLAEAKAAGFTKSTIKAVVKARALERKAEEARGSRPRRPRHVRLDPAQPRRSRRPAAREGRSGQRRRRERHARRHSARAPARAAAHRRGGVSAGEVMRVDATLLRLRLHYEPSSGSFTWLRRDDCTDRWNTRYAGKEAGTPKWQGWGWYWQINLNGRCYKAHRLAWLYMTGEWPSLPIDHRDGDGLSNRWDNLRLSTVSQNNANQQRRRDNTTGFKGVTWHKAAGRYQAKIGIAGASHYLGLFDTPEAAHAAYRAAASRAYGAFARPE